MRAASLFLVFALAKLLIVWGRDMPLSPWTPLAYLWQDGLVAVIFAVFDFACRRRAWIGWSAYGIIVGYTAINVPVACLLATPLTWPMLRAARGTLADSIAYHVTPANLVRVAIVLAAGILLPVALRRWRIAVPKRMRAVAVVAVAACLLLGPAATSRIATLGLHRNVIAVLVTTALPRITAKEEAGDWRMSPFGNPRAEDLIRFRGLAAGRNVVIIHLESTGARYLKPYGAAEDPMPNLTALTREGILFENAYTTYPETIRSFFAVQNSLFPALDTPAENYEKAPSPALAELLADKGYRTGLFHSGRFCYLGMESVVRNRGYQTREDAGDIGGNHESSFGIDEPSAVRRILQWIDDGPREQPFLVSFLPIAGHHPYAVPALGPFPQEDEVGRYRNALHYSDAALGQLLHGLRKRGQYENTLFVIMGDHGEAFEQHSGNYGHTLFIYEENLRVPYVIVAPGLIHEPVLVGRVASLIDTAPTVLDLLGMPIPSAYQGRSLLDDQTGMALFCTDYSLGLLGLRDGRWKCIHELESGRTLLFDLQDDPDEKSDVSSLHPERVGAYRDHLLRWAAGQKYLFTGPGNKRE
jgi:glucan phosphoethanolaminetransferase (alkaline phosphatase superfamily)